MLVRASCVSKYCEDAFLHEEDTPRRRLPPVVDVPVLPLIGLRHHLDDRCCERLPPVHCRALQGIEEGPPGSGLKTLRTVLVGKSSILLPPDEGPSG